jgi:hypothetical protein
MESAQAEALSGEGKAVTSERSRLGEVAAARFEALIRKPVKTVAGEPESYAHGAPKCDAQYRACR